MPRDEDLSAYGGRYTTDAEYNDMRARDIAENVKDDLDNLTSDLQLALEYKPLNAIKKVLDTVNECIGILDDVVSGAVD